MPLRSALSCSGIGLLKKGISNKILSSYEIVLTNYIMILFPKKHIQQSMLCIYAHMVLKGALLFNIHEI